MYYAIYAEGELVEFGDESRGKINAAVKRRKSTKPYKHITLLTGDKALRSLPSADREFFMKYIRRQKGRS